jgi:hypothetical protein
MIEDYDTGELTDDRCSRGFWDLGAVLRRLGALVACGEAQAPPAATPAPQCPPPPRQPQHRSLHPRRPSRQLPSLPPSPNSICGDAINRSAAPTVAAGAAPAPAPPARARLAADDPASTGSQAVTCRTQSHHVGQRPATTARPKADERSPGVSVPSRKPRPPNRYTWGCGARRLLGAGGPRLRRTWPRARRHGQVGADRSPASSETPLENWCDLTPGWTSWAASRRARQIGWSASLWRRLHATAGGCQPKIAAACYYMHSQPPTR